MRSGSFLLLIGFIFILLTDTLLFIQIKQYLHTKRYILLYWLHSLIFLAGLIVYNFSVPLLKGPEAYFRIGIAFGILFLFYAPKIILILLNLFAWLSGYINRGFGKIIKQIALLVTAASFLLILYSITLGRSDFKIKTTEICLTTLPPAFNNLKIVQLSDLHLGSHSKSYKGIRKLVDEVNALHPDLIFFTGDMVNNFASETTPWINELSRLKAKYGKFAVTGNHDYGDYTKWNTPEEQHENLQQFFNAMEAMGFQMLNNRNVPLTLNGDTLYIAGVENWGKPPFPKYGKLLPTIEHIKDEFIILLSHDPSHWRQEVLEHAIPLTLSGHTHAMQMGIEIGNFKWSPSKYIYPEYDGLYKNGECYLYVSRGQGYLGFPGRIGMKPEISVIVLINK